MHPVITELEKNHSKPAVARLQSGDTVRVHQLIREGSKQRIQIFEGVVIRTDRMGGVTASVTVRRIASGVGVEKTFLLHSPNVDKIEVMRRAQVRRNFLSYLRGRRGKSARLKELGFDKAEVNVIPVAQLEEPVAEDKDPELEIDTQEAVQPEPNVSTEEIAQEENKEAAADDPSSDDGGSDQGDEAVLPAEEAEAGVDKAQPNNQ